MRVSAVRDEPTGCHEAGVLEQGFCSLDECLMVLEIAEQRRGSRATTRREKTRREPQPHRLFAKVVFDRIDFLPALTSLGSGLLTPRRGICARSSP
jgi:hypothetical protein